MAFPLFALPENVSRRRAKLFEMFWRHFEEPRNETKRIFNDFSIKHKHRHGFPDKGHLQPNKSQGSPLNEFNTASASNHFNLCWLKLERYFRLVSLPSIHPSNWSFLAKTSERKDIKSFPLLVSCILLWGTENFPLPRRPFARAQNFLLDVKRFPSPLFCTTKAIKLINNKSANLEQ